MVLTVGIWKICWEEYFSLEEIFERQSIEYMGNDLRDVGDVGRLSNTLFSNFSANTKWYKSPIFMHIPTYSIILYFIFYILNI